MLTILELLQTYSTPRKQRKRPRTSRIHKNKSWIEQCDISRNVQMSTFFHARCERNISFTSFPERHSWAFRYIILSERHMASLFSVDSLAIVLCWTFSLFCSAYVTCGALFSVFCVHDVQLASVYCPSGTCCIGRVSILAKQLLWTSHQCQF